MTTALRIVRLVALAAWVGGGIFFVVMAGLAFKTLPDAATAGTIVRASLIALHRMGMGEGLIYLLVTLGLLAMVRDTHPVRAVELVLIVAMLGLTIYSQLSVLPRMETDRLTLGGDVTKAPDDAVARKHFERLHGLSEKLEGAVLILGLGLLGLATVHGRDDFDRFA